jgi:hypothetical protein
MLWGWYGENISNVAVMTLTALLSAQLPSLDGDGDGLAALLPVAGMTLLERQAEDAAAIGANDLLVLVDSVPAELTAAVDRIRLRGIAVTMVRDADAVIAATAGGLTKLLLVADGLIAPRALWEALAGASAPRLLAVSDTPATAALERIDGQRRWAGLATVDASAIAALAALPADWDPQLALLRGTIQGNAPSILCEPQMFERGDIALLNRGLAADLVEQRLLAKGTDAVVGLVHANLAMPIARAAARLLLRGQYGGLIAGLVTVAGAAGGIAALLFGYPVIAFAAALIGLLARAGGAIIRAFRPETSMQNTLYLVGEGLFAAAIMAAAWAAAARDPGHVFLWLAVGLAVMLLIRLGRVLADRGAAVAPLLFDDGALWLLLGVGIVVGGAWPMALAAAVPLAVAAMLVAVWQKA